MAKILNYNVNFEVISGDLTAAAENLERRFIGTQMDYGKAIVRVAGMKKLNPTVKPKADALGLKRAAGLTD